MFSCHKKEKYSINLRISQNICKKVSFSLTMHDSHINGLSNIYSVNECLILLGQRKHHQKFPMLILNNRRENSIS